MRYTGPKNKLARREQADLGLKTSGSKAQSNLIKRLNIIPGQHGSKRRRRPSDYGIQLRQKQRLKRMYGVSERQMKNYFKQASKRVGNTTTALVELLEHRLDNVVYRLGIAPTRTSARQLASHGHISVNKQKVTIPSYQVQEGDKVGLFKQKTAEIPYVAQSLEREDHVLPEWLKRKGPTGEVVGRSGREHLKDIVDLKQVIEFYSR